MKKLSWMPWRWKVILKPRVCVVVTARSSEEAHETVKGLLQLKPELVEIRLDYLKGSIKLGQLRASTDIPLIATYRKHNEGGVGVHKRDDRTAILMDACKAGFDYVDLELSTVGLVEHVKEAKNLGAKVIVSYHNFNTTPNLEALQDILYQMKDRAADICKIIGTAEKPNDNLVYLQLLEDNPDVSLVTFGMGQNGGMSRIFSPFFGAALTFASMGRGRESAPGQLTLKELKSIYRALGV